MMSLINDLFFLVVDLEQDVVKLKGIKSHNRVDKY